VSESASLARICQAIGRIWLRTVHSAHSGDLDQPFRRIAIRHSGRSRAVWRGARDGAVGHVG
jgi:hypothetical protein